MVKNEVSAKTCQNLDFEQILDDKLRSSLRRRRNLRRVVTNGGYAQNYNKDPKRILMQIRCLESRRRRNLRREVTNGGYAQNYQGEKEEQRK